MTGSFDSITIDKISRRFYETCQDVALELGKEKGPPWREMSALDKEQIFRSFETLLRNGTLRSGPNLFTTPL